MFSIPCIFFSWTFIRNMKSVLARTPSPYMLSNVTSLLLQLKHWNSPTKIFTRHSLPLDATEIRVSLWNVETVNMKTEDDGDLLPVQLSSHIVFCCICEKICSHLYRQNFICLCFSVVTIVTVIFCSQNWCTNVH